MKGIDSAEQLHSRRLLDDDMYSSHTNELVLLTSSQVPDELMLVVSTLPWLQELYDTPPDAITG